MGKGAGLDDDVEVVTMDHGHKKKAKSKKSGRRSMKAFDKKSKRKDKPTTPDVSDDEFDVTGARIKRKAPTAGASGAQAKRLKVTNLEQSSKLNRKPDTKLQKAADPLPITTIDGYERDENSPLCILTRKYTNQLEYKAGEPLNSTKFNLEFVARAVDEDVSYHSGWGPSLGVIYAIAQVFPESRNLVGGFKAWDEFFEPANKDKGESMLSALIKQEYRKYDYRRVVKGSLTWGTNNQSQKSLKRRISSACTSSNGQKNTMARFLVKLFDAYDSSHSRERRIRELGDRITKLGSRMIPRSDNDEWKRVLNKRIALPDFIVKLGYTNAKIDNGLAIDLDDTDVFTECEEDSPENIALKKQEEGAGLKNELLMMQRKQKSDKAERDREVVRLAELKLSIVNIEKSISERTESIDNRDILIADLQTRVEALDEFQDLLGEDRATALNLKDLCTEVKTFKTDYARNKTRDPGPMMACFKNVFGLPDFAQWCVEQPATPGAQHVGQQQQLDEFDKRKSPNLSEPDSDNEVENGNPLNGDPMKDNIDDGHGKNQLVANLGLDVSGSSDEKEDEVEGSKEDEEADVSLNDTTGNEAGGDGNDGDTESSEELQLH